MNRIIILVITFCLASARLSAQLPDLMPPSELPGLCESLQTSSFIKSTKTYNLKGKVKSVIETISSDTALREHDGLPTQIHYEFLPNGNLIRYADDTILPLANWNPVIKEYFFDPSGEKLERSRFYELIPGHSSVSERWFDTNGFCTKMEYACFNCDQPATRTKEFAAVFDYTLTYHWTENYSAVARKYLYKTRSLYYERYRDDSVSCRIASAGREIDSTASVKLPDNFIFNQFGGTTFTYDDAGRVIKKLVIDRVIKSSMNIDQLTELSYTPEGNVAEIKHYSAIAHVQPYAFLLGTLLRIDYLAFDEQGNWTKCKVNIIPGPQDYHHHRSQTTFTYERSLSYY